MYILERHKVPTGDICVLQGDKGKLEALSIGDYGKDVNIKCDALGLSRELGSVQHTEMLPLEEKWVITISTQYGCSMGCTFCDVPKVGKGKNATTEDLFNQVIAMISLHPEVESTKRLNLHYARMGEPTFNFSVLAATEWLSGFLQPNFTLHPVVSTMMPRNNAILKLFIKRWMAIKNGLFRGNAGLQLSINSTCRQERSLMFKENACTLEEIHNIMKGIEPAGRKITLNFAVAGYEIDPLILLSYFDPKHYIIKLTPMHKTKSCLESGIETDGDYTTFHPYKEIEEKLTDAGYDVLVFIASKEEDESRITCGNAVLSDPMFMPMEG
jgi:23S rRNA (adenine2503-C2)-methyltransferase